jgi:hypothetical protein
VGPQGAQGAAGPPAASCFSVSVGVGSSCEEACGARPETFYSNCTNITDGCCLYEDSSCTSCVPPGQFYAGGNDDGCYTVVDGENCQCQLEISQSCGGSDEILKTEIKTLTNSLHKVLSLNPVEFDWTEDTPEYSYYLENKKLHSLGFIAQEVREFIPEVVKIRSDGYYFIDYPKLNAYLVEGIKEHQVFIEKLESSIIELEKKVNN